MTSLDWVHAKYKAVAVLAALTVKLDVPRGIPAISHVDLVERAGVPFHEFIGVMTAALRPRSRRGVKPDRTPHSPDMPGGEVVGTTDWCLKHFKNICSTINQ